MNHLKIKILSILFLSIVFISCKKWVDYNPKDDFKITDQEYLKSEAHYRAMTVGTYAPLQWLNQIVPVGDILTENSVTGGESASDVMSLQQLDDYTYFPINSTLSDLWQSAYEGINRANYLHQYKDKNLADQTINFPGKDALYGEVYFLRAYYYFTLVKMYGGVPLFVDKRLTLADSKNLSRATKADVYKQIEKDLTDAINVLPIAQVDQGRATKYAAQALLGKVYLYQNKFDDAATMLENVIGKFSLVSNFESIFLPSGENGIESVFEIQYSNGSATYDWAHVTRGQGNFSVQQCGIRGLNGSSAMPYNPGWSTNLPTQNLAAAYTAGDSRKAVTVLDIEAYKAANPAMNITYQVAPYRNTGLYNQKFLPRKGQTSGQVELNYSNNFRTIRYADVLLMAAEANNKASAANDVKARNYLNQVRQRAFGNNLNDVISSGTALYEAILHERRLEFAMEGERFFDLVRTGKAATVLGPLGFVNGKHNLFPIPQAEVDISGLQQNPGY